MQDPSISTRSRRQHRILLRLVLGVAASTAALVSFARSPLMDIPTRQKSAAKRGDTAAIAPLRVANGVKVLPTFAESVKLTDPVEGIIPGMTIQRDQRTGQIRRVRGEWNSKREFKQASDAARAFLSEYANVLGLSANLSELRSVREVESLTGVHITYQQVYAGLPVFGGELSVHLGKDGSVRLVNHDLLPVTQSPKLNAPKNNVNAIQAALAATGTVTPNSTPTAEAGILVDSGIPRSVWRVRYMDNSQTADFDVMVDGSTGKVLTVRNDNRFATGTGKVYEVNAVQATGIASLTDNNNADSPTLTNARVSVSLQGLDGSGFLTGTYATTAVLSGQTRAFSASLNFDYTRSQNQFEETMCYYHIDQIARYIQSLGFSNIENRQVTANVNTITDDNSFYSPSTKQITFGDGGVDDAEDADVIWHENGHAIQDNQVPGWGATEQGGAMGEGFGDYWAGTHEAENPGAQPAGWEVYLAKWDATSYNPGNPAFLRVLNSTKHYPENADGEVHDDGEMWSASLWQFRTLVGKARADKTVLEAHFSVSPSGTFADGANAIIAANQSLYGGADQTAIRQIFINRGFIQVHTAPTNLAATANSGTQVVLTWNDTNNNEDGFRIERSTSGGAFSEIGTVGANVLTYTDNTAVPNTDYSYRVRAYSSLGNSNYSNVANVSTPNQTYSISGRVAGVTGINGVSVTATGTAAVQNTYSVSPELSIPDNNTTGVTSTLNVPDSGTITAIKVGINLTHTWIGDLEVSVIAPDGTTVIVHNRTGGSADDIITSYPNLTTPDQPLTPFIGKQINGAWKMKVRDLAALDVGVLHTWSLTLTYNGTVTRTVTTNGSGDFTLPNLPTGTYTVAPTTAAYSYSPANRSVTVGPDASAQNFTANTTVGGTISLQSVVNAAQPLAFTFRPASGSPFTRNATLTSSGAYSLTGIPAGSYTLSIKGAKWLRKNVTFNSGAGNVSNANAALLGGDATNDNFADINDLLVLIGAYNTSSGQGAFSDAADFNCDGVDDINDLLILISNYNQQGDL